jgi:hypothetical protein
MLFDEAAHRGDRLIRALADGGNAGGGNNAPEDIEQKKGKQCNREEPYGMSQKGAHGNNERSDPHGFKRRARHVVPRQRLVRHPVQRFAHHRVQRLARHRVQRLARHRMQWLTALRQRLVSGRGLRAQFDCLGNLTKALTFSPQRATRVAESRVPEHAGLIHALEAGHDPGPQQQPALFDQLGYFREAQIGITEGLHGPILGGLGRLGVLRVHLLHGLFQECHVIDHRKTTPAIVPAMTQAFRRRMFA